ncbi:hypothetical protein RSOLAG22IIIB_06347 [Rhizoctonia solani]|uniref:Uncharacterized protein n=1 Tax=Rhizoctonia solani TaxID=456999 RepID=A0A0K6GDW9_9AGAM|nr:hypothetical protein RSOLAG22IIIB_06347 [Rhizoctonia solani]
MLLFRDFGGEVSELVCEIVEIARDAHEDDDLPAVNFSEIGHQSSPHTGFPTLNANARLLGQKLSGFLSLLMAKRSHQAFDRLYFIVRIRGCIAGIRGLIRTLW